MKRQRRPDYKPDAHKAPSKKRPRQSDETSRHGVPLTDRIVVAIDFGTTFSGVAFSYAGNPDDPDDISVVKEWPGSNNRTSDKVPTELAYDTNSTGTVDVQWGYELKPQQNGLRYLKLILDPHQEFPAYASKETLCSQLEDCGKTPVEAVSDYLSNLYRYAQQALRKRYGEHMVSTTKIEFVMTVPAVWSDAAKDATLKAAVRAGVDTNVYMVSEPEAAAVYALQSLEHNLLKVGDNFIVCDAGGGTVDLISYQVTSLKPLRLEEAAPGRGALCGGAFLNMRFEDLVKKRLTPAVFKHLCNTKPKCWPAALNHFEEYVKRNFEASMSQDEFDNGSYLVLLPGAADNEAAGIDSGYITISKAEVTEIFRPVVNRVIELIKEQKQLLSGNGKTAKGIILVGGFGQSKHLHQTITACFADKDLPPPYTEDVSNAHVEDRVSGLHVIQPVNAWTAVLRGAVLSGFEGGKLVLSRKSRRHYGALCSRVFDHRIHSTGNRYWDDLNEAYYAKNSTTWHVHQGQDLPSRTPTLIELTTTSEHTIPTTCGTSIIVSEDEEAPEEFRSGGKTRVLCTLTVDTQQVPRSRWQTKTTSTGRRYNALEYEVGMTVDSGRIIFDLRVNGKVYGTVEADYE